MRQMQNRPRDVDAVRGRKVERGTVRRAWSFARPFRPILIVFRLAIVVDPLIGLVPPFAFRSILDTAIPNKDRTLITVLAGLVVAQAIADAGLTIIQRWCRPR